MLSDEERELIEEIQKGNKIGIYELIRTFKREGIKNFITVRRKYIDIMINLIEKQSKEIEELKEKNENLLDALNNSIFITKYWVSKSKIKDKIEELDEEIKVKREIAKNPMDRVSGRLLTDNIVELEKAKKVLESLLEKE